MPDTLVLNRDYQPITLLPLSAISWRNAIRLSFLGKLDIIEEYEDWVVHSPSISMNVPAVVVTKEYFKFKKNIRFSRANVYIRDMFQCQYCSEHFDRHELTLDHVMPLSKGGKTNWENCVCCCKECNAAKADKIRKPLRTPIKPDYYQLANQNVNVMHKIKHPSWEQYLKVVEYT